MYRYLFLAHYRTLAWLILLGIGGGGILCKLTAVSQIANRSRGAMVNVFAYGLCWQRKIPGSNPGGIVFFAF
jgi:hypothetical protein